MPQMINRGKELIRICPRNKQRIEYSINGGRSWITRNQSVAYGEYQDLIDGGKEILMQTSKGLYYSNNEGKTWILRHL